ncbi:MAG: PqqD family protein, partial [Firmicutes bacterium]|nr:PqqD family protein [Bacillota bacterium]
RALEDGASKEELVKKLTAEYEVDDATASADIDAFIARLREASLLDD